MKSTLLQLILLVVLSKDVCLASRRTRQANFEETPVDPAEGPCTTSEETPGVCTPTSRCTSLLDDLTQGRCTLSGQENAGICCPTTPQLTEEEPVPLDAVAFSAPAVGSVQFSPPVVRTLVSPNDVNIAIGVGEEDLRKQDELEQTLLDLGIVAQPGTPEATHQFIQFTEESSLAASRDAHVVQETASDISRRFEFPASDAPRAISAFSLSDTPLQKACPIDPECLATKYRSIDGSCNNLNHRNWGKSQRAFNRMMPPKYSDGVSKPRVASDGSELPSSRLISESVLQDIQHELKSMSLLVMTWGQFLDHDLIQTPLSRGRNNTGIVCCHPTILANLTLLHPNCFPIWIPENDKVFSKANGTKAKCMEFVRALEAKPNDCTLSHREQQNQLTAYIDASHIYGSTESTTENLREKSGGRLKSVKLDNGREMPPTKTGPGGCQSRPTTHEFCFEGGDTRGSEHPQLATLQLIFLREHNRIAAELAKLNPGWNDEALYQESRRIVGAMMQHITYNEFLTIVLGRRTMQKFKILLTPFGFTNDYDPEVDATILNEFATAAYRFGHSNIPGFVELLTGSKKKFQPLRDLFLQPYDTTLVDSYILGAVSQPSQTTDNFITTDVTSMLFRNIAENGSLGLDLPAINMQRGRDHGIPGYNDVRQHCRLRRVSSFKEMEYLFINPNVAKSLSTLYKNVDDVDLWVAGVSEKHIKGGIVGETFACILGEQFKRLKLGDRLWYERANTQSTLTEAQISEIRKTSLARVFCDNSDISEIQPLVFFTPSPWNNPVKCNSKAIPKISLKPWENEPVWA